MFRQSQPEQKLLEKEPSKKLDLTPLMPWETKEKTATFATEVIEIKASIDQVWQQVMQVEHYEKFSAGAYKATIKKGGEPEPEKTIVLKLHGVPESIETIKIAKLDDKAQIATIGWTRELPCCFGTSERYQLLQATSEGTTLSQIAVRMPKSVALTTIPIKKVMMEDFNKLHEGIRTAAEKEAKPQSKPSM